MERLLEEGLSRPPTEDPAQPPPGARVALYLRGRPAEPRSSASGRRPRRATTAPRSSASSRASSAEDGGGDEEGGLHRFREIWARTVLIRGAELFKRERERERKHLAHMLELDGDRLTQQR